MTEVHPTAVVEPGAELGSGVKVGPFCHVEAGAVLGDGCKLESYATVRNGTTMGARNTVCQGAVIGGDPQDRKYSGEPTFLRIGEDNTFREYVTIHRATGEGNSTVVGSRCFLMAFVHLGHNCHLMDDITIANNVGLAGHVTVESLSSIMGMTGVHQFARVGRAAFVAGMSRIVKDCPPFMISGGMDQQVYDINAIGLRRLGIGQETRLALHKVCKLMFKSQLSFRHSLEVVLREVNQLPEVEELVKFAERSAAGKNGRQDQP